eukprot:SAG11_NODE_25348_length_360_cov_0.590038_1_plen_87_part_10
MQHLQQVWGAMPQISRERSVFRLRMLASHLLGPECVAPQATSSMLVPLPGTPAFGEWMDALLAEARRQRSAHHTEQRQLQRPNDSDW